LMQSKIAWRSVISCIWASSAARRSSVVIAVSLF
jgi:hypothetical protein